MEDVSNETCDEAFATFEIPQAVKRRKINLQRKVDTGAQRSVLPIRLLQIIAPEKCDDDGNPRPEVLEKNEAVLSAFGGSIIKQLGAINVPCKYKEEKISCIFYVTNTAGPGILGLKACTALKRVLLHCTLKTSQPDLAGPTGSLNISAQHSDISRRSVNYIESHVPIEVRPSIRSKQDLNEDVPRMF